MLKTYSLNIFRCDLCLEVILAEHKSSTCPFCGAHNDYIIRARDWIDKSNIEKISEISKKNLEKALELELESEKFYKCSASYSQKIENKAIFQSLAKIEMEHVFLISKVLKKPKIETEIQDICFRFDQENIEGSFKFEKKMKEFYINAFNQATEPRIKEIFLGLMETEGDHLELLKEKM